MSDTQREQQRVSSDQSEEEPIVARLRERLDGQIRQPEFETLLLDSAQAYYGTGGRGYLETRLLMAATFESVLLETDDERHVDPPMGHV